MTDKKSDFKAAMDILVDQDREKVRELSPEEVLAFHEKDMSEDEEKQLLERLLPDKNAVKSLLDLDAFPSGSVPEMSEQELEGSWQEFWGKLEETEGSSNRDQPSLSRSVVIHRWSRIVTGLAAAFLLATVGLTLWVISLKQAYPGPGIATMDAAISDIYPDRTRSTPNQVMLLRSVQTVRFHLSEKWQPYPLYLVEIRDSKDKLILSIKGRADEQNALTIILTHHSFSEPGQYRATVFGLKGEDATPLKGFMLTAPDA